MRNPLDIMRIRRGVINNTFGMVRRRDDGTAKPHQGWDLYAPEGTTIYAIADGAVQFAYQRSNGDYGRQICIRFQDPNSEEPRTLYTFYGHLSRVDILSGEINEGDVLGATGTSGNASGMRGQDQHLHFEIRDVAAPGRGLNGRLNPAELLGPPPL